MNFSGNLCGISLSSLQLQSWFAAHPSPGSRFLSPHRTSGAVKVNLGVKKARKSAVRAQTQHLK